MSTPRFAKGDTIEFQDFRRCWKRGTVQCWEPEEGSVHVLYHDSFQRTLRVLKLNPKRVRHVSAT